MAAASPSSQKLAGTSIALCGLLWGILFFVAILAAGYLQLFIENDAALYVEYSAASCGSGSQIGSLDFSKGSGCLSLYKPSGAPLFVSGACDITQLSASVTVCADAACSAGCVTYSSGLFNNCSDVGPLFGGLSAKITCIDEQHALGSSVGLISTIAISLAALLALYTLADLQAVVKSYVPWLFLGAANADAAEGRAGV